MLQVSIKVKDGTSLETGIRQTLKAQLPKNHEFLRCSDNVSLTQLFKATRVVQEEDELTDIEDGIDIPPIGSRKFETLDKRSASGDVEEDVEETKLKHELVKIIRSGQTKTLRPNSDKCTKIGNQLIYVTNYMEPESDYRIWEWYGNIKLAFDDNSEFKTEFVHGTYKENVKAGLDNGSSGDDSEDAQEDGVSGSERKSHKAVLKIGMKPDSGLSFTTIKNPNNEKTGDLSSQLQTILLGQQLKRGDNGSTSALVGDAEEETGIKDCDI